MFQIKIIGKLSKEKLLPLWYSNLFLRKCFLYQKYSLNNSTQIYFEYNPTLHVLLTENPFKIWISVPMCIWRFYLKHIIFEKWAQFLWTLLNIWRFFTHMVKVVLFFECYTQNSNLNRILNLLFHVSQLSFHAITITFSRIHQTPSSKVLRRALSKKQNLKFGLVGQI